MTFWRLIRRSLAHYWRSNAAVVFGVAVAVAVLVGSLMVGDSVRGSLRELASERLGRVDYALAAPSFFTEELGNRLLRQDRAAERCDLAVPAIVLQGSVERAASDSMPAQVSVIGVRDEFWKLGRVNREISLEGRQVALNQDLADDLGAAEDDAVLLRLVRQGDAPVDTAFGRRSPQDTVSNLRLNVARVISSEGLGKFSLRNDNPRPANIYVPLSWLQDRLNRSGRANALLVSAKEGYRTDDTLSVLEDALGEAGVPADYGLKLSEEEGGYLSLESAQMVMDPAAVDAARVAAEEADLRAEIHSIYLANSLDLIENGETTASVPYSVVAGVNPRAAPPLGPLPMTDGEEPPELGRNDILLNEWAAERLSTSAGSTIRMSYYVWTERGQLETRSRELTLRGVVKMQGPAIDTGLIPEYEGVTDAATMADWDPPFPLDRNRIDLEDDRYWEQYGPAPKAFLSPGTVRSLWQASGEGGDGWVTGIGILPGGRSLDQTREVFSRTLQKQLNPRDFGLAFLPVKERALESARGSTDFGVLFLSMSMFIVAAAAGLVALLLRLTVQRRASQFGIMLATGFSRPQAVRAVLGESVLLALAGSVLGAPLGVGYAALIIHTLRTWWQGAVAGFPLSLHVSATSIVIGCVSGLVVALAAMWWAVRTLRKVSALDLLPGWRSLVTRPAGRERRWARRVGVVSLLIGAVLLILGLTETISSTGAFFGVGAAVFVGLLGLLLGYLEAPEGAVGRPSLSKLAWRAASQNWIRSTLTVGLVACASFIIVTVAANRRDPSLLNTREMDSGAGGFNLMARSSLPVYYDPGSAEGREKLGFSDGSEDVFKDAQIFSLSLSEGDDVSCLNLQRPDRPRILGVPQELVDRGGFTFQGLAEYGSQYENPWKLLEEPVPGPTEGKGTVIPAFADAASARWILKMGLGDEIEVQNKNGETVRLRLVGLIANSIFAGEILIGQQQFEKHFVGGSSYQFFLVRTPPEKERAVEKELEDNLGKLGITITRTADELAQYAQVQNTYLATFRTLGGLGLLLGTLGVVTVLLRGVVERRSQLALMLALGFRRWTLVSMVALENGMLLVVGLVVGTVAALVAVAPHLASTVADVRWGSLVAILAACLVIGLVFCLGAAAGSVRSELLNALRSE